MDAVQHVNVINNVLDNALNHGTTMSVNGVTPLETRQLVVAECNPAIAQSLCADLAGKGWEVVGQCATSAQVLRVLVKTRVDLLLLGELEGANCFAVFRECRDRWQSLPIVLLSHQPVSEFFRDWAIQRGVNDVVNADSKYFEALQRTIIRVLHDAPPGSHTIPLASSDIPGADLLPDLSQTILTGAEIRDALNELTGLAVNYFGPLAIGNYWRKAHQKAVAEYAWLAAWTVDHFGQVSMGEGLQGETLDATQVQSIQAWIHLFLEECQRIIVDFPKLLSKTKLSPTLEELLFS